MTFFFIKLHQTIIIKSNLRLKVTFNHYDYVFVKIDLFNNGIIVFSDIKFVTLRISENSK